MTGMVCCTMARVAVLCNDTRGVLCNDTRGGVCNDTEVCDARPVIPLLCIV